MSVTLTPEFHGKPHVMSIQMNTNKVLYFAATNLEELLDWAALVEYSLSFLNWRELLAYAQQASGKVCSIFHLTSSVHQTSQTEEGDYPASPKPRESGIELRKVFNAFNPMPKEKALYCCECRALFKDSASKVNHSKFFFGDDRKKTSTIVNLAD